jgi:hypothetical protein
MRRARGSGFTLLVVVLVTALAGTAGSSEHDLRPGPERPASEPFYQRSFPASTNAAIASDGGAALIVWAEQRLHGDGIFATLVSAAGQVLTPGSITIGRGTFGNPAVAFDGSAYVVVFEELSAGGIYARRVDPEGVPLDDEPVRIAPAGARAPAVAASSGVSLVVYAKGQEVHAVRFASGTPQAPIVLGPAYSPAPAPDVAFSGKNFLAVWTSCDFPSRRCFVNLYGARVAPSGAALDRPPLALVTPHQQLSEPAIAPEDDGYVLAWIRQSKQQRSVQAAHVGPDGRAGDTFELSSGQAALVATPDLAHDGDGTVAVWEEDQTIVSASVDLARLGVTAAMPISGLGVDPQAPALAPVGDGYLAAWHDSPRGRDPDVFAADLGPAGEPRSLPNGDISIGANEQIHAAAARGELVYLAAWQDYRRRNGAAELFGGRISADGVALDGTGFSLQLGDVRRPAIAYGMGMFLVVAERHRADGSVELLATRVTEEGMVLDPGGIPIALEGVNQEPSVVFNGQDFAVTWVRKNRGGVMFTRVTTAGVVRQPGGVEVADGRGPQIAFNGRDHLLVYTTRSRYIEALVFNVDEPPDIADPIRISFGDDVELNPAVAAAPGGRFLVVWEQCSDLCTHHDLYAARVTGAGTVLDEAGFPVATSVAHETNAALAFNGEVFVTAFQRCVPPELCVPQPPLARPRLIDPLFGVRITPGGEVLDPGGVPVTDADKWNRPPALAAGGDGTVILLYQRTEPLPPYGDTARIFLRVLGAAPR